MKTLSLLLLCAALCGCSSTPKLDQQGQPPPGWQLTPKPPIPW